MQLTYYNSKFKIKSFPITLLCENVTNAANVGSLFRTADAFGIEKLIFSGKAISFDRKMTKTSRATEKYVSHEWVEDIEASLKNLKTIGHQIIALEITNTSIPLINMKFEATQPIALLVGDENFGVSERCLELADQLVHIDMFGQNSSMNVVQATSIALYEITKQLRR